MSVSPYPSFFRSPVESAQLKRVEFALRKHFDALYRFVRRLGVPQGDLEDVLQEISIVALSRASMIEFDREGPYLFGVAYRIASNARRRSQSRDEVSDDLLVECIDEGNDPTRALDQEQAQKILNVILSQLPEDLRTVFILHEVEELSMADIACALGIPSGTVASRLRRAREQFDVLLSRVRS